MEQYGGLLSFAAVGTGLGLIALAPDRSVQAQILLLIFGVVFAAMGLIGVYLSMRTETAE